MKVKSLTLSFLFLAFLTLSAQQNTKFAERIIIGNSLTYISEKNETSFDRLVYNEYTWNKDIAVNINKHIYVGLSHKNIFTKGSIVNELKPKNDYFLLGVFSQFDFLPKTKNRLFLELSWNYGNYCTCGDDDPFKQDKLNYFGWGVGYDLPLNNFISLDLGFNAYLIASDAVQKYGYTQYIIGLNFDLVNKK